jgi:hypothetical protein
MVYRGLYHFSVAYDKGKATKSNCFTIMNDTNQKLKTIDDRIQTTVQAIQAEHDWWLCRRGCDGCCRQLARPPELSELEWARVDQAVAALVPEVRAEVENKIDALLVQIAEDAVGQYVVS